MQHSIVFGERIERLGPSDYLRKRVFTFSANGISAGSVLTEDEWQDHSNLQGYQGDRK